MPGQPLQRHTVTLHSVAVQDSTSAAFKVPKGRCTVALEEGFNMSALRHFAHYTGGKGGRDGVLNQAQVQALTVAPVAPVAMEGCTMNRTAKPQLSFWQIWNMCFGFLGIQFGFALQNANASRIFETLGADIDAVPGLWIAAPLTGLLVQPVIGYLSDRTWTRWGAVVRTS